MRTLSSATLRKYRGKICLLRIDLNIESGDSAGLFRLDAVIPTIKLLLKNRIKVVIVSHRGRPAPLDDNDVKLGKSAAQKMEDLSLGVFAPLIASRVRVPVDFIQAVRVGALARAARESTAKVVLFDNIRFYRGEEANDASFAKGLAKAADFYVNDAFAVSHRKNASVAAITAFLPSFAGPLLAREVKELSAVMRKPAKPFVIIVGGAKAADKLGVIGRFWKKADTFLVGGGAANTMLAAEGIPVGRSLYEPDIVKGMRQYAFSGNIVLPVDVREDRKAILDIGKKTEKEFTEIIRGARTIVWNGPMGLYEKTKFASGTRAVWRAVLQNKKAQTIVGGGETIASLRLVRGTKVPKNVFLSTGGGAMLEYLGGEKLPGIEALS